MVIAHDGDDSYYAAVFNSTFGLKLFQVVDGSWGSSLKEVSYSIGAGDYILRASYRQGRMQASLTSTADLPVVLIQFDYDIRRSGPSFVVAKGGGTMIAKRVVSPRRGARQRRRARRSATTARPLAVVHRCAMNGAPASI